MVLSTQKGVAASRQDTRYVFPMAVVEKMTGLTRRRIRYYEEQGLLKPGRSAGGHRLYSPSNVETLMRIRDIMSGGITTMEAVSRMIASDLDRPNQRYSRLSTSGDAAGS
jgi:DNA-binding transcriptional MerR regulator